MRGEEVKEMKEKKEGGRAGGKTKKRERDGKFVCEKGIDGGAGGAELLVK